jgi:lipopolysaccharide transport system permease protein
MKLDKKILLSDSEEWTTIIKPQKSVFEIDVVSVWKYRDLIMLFVQRDFVAIYKQTVLGPLWFLLQPLFTMTIYTIIFGYIARMQTDGLPYPLFFLSGIVVWNYFSSCFLKTSDVFITNAGIFGKVYFPRLTVPVAIVITNLLTFTIQFILFLIFIAFFYFTRGQSVQFTYWVFALPLMVLQMALLGLGFGILVSSLTTKYRDLAFVVSFGIQLWMFATPVVYPMSLIPAQWQYLYALNPMVSILEIFRLAFLGAGTVHAWQWATSWIVTTLFLCIGVVLFSRVEKTFMDTV